MAKAKTEKKSAKTKDSAHIRAADLRGMAA